MPSTQVDKPDTLVRYHHIRTMFLRLYWHFKGYFPLRKWIDSSLLANKTKIAPHHEDAFRILGNRLESITTLNHSFGCVFLYYIFLYCASRHVTGGYSCSDWTADGDADWPISQGRRGLGFDEREQANWHFSMRSESAVKNIPCFTCGCLWFYGAMNI